MAVGSRVHERAVGPTAKCLNRINDLAFSVVLRERELDTEFLRDLQEPRLDVGESFGSVETRLTRAKQIEVGAIDYGDSHSPVSPSSQARNLATSSSDSCVWATRGLTRGVGMGGVGGVLDVPPVPLNAPAKRDAARLSEGLTVAPAKTWSSDALGGEAPSDDPVSDDVLLPERAGPPGFP